jgi:hypothetical protein
MTRMLRTIALSSLTLMSTICGLQLKTAASAEPAVEINPTSSSSTAGGDTTAFSLPHIPLTIELFTHGGYDDNVGTSQSAQSSWFVNGGGSLFYDLPNATTHVTVKAGADASYFFEHTSGQQDDVNVYIDGTLVRNVSERLKLDATLYATYRTEPNFGANVGSSNRIGNFFHTLDSLKATYHWTERFATATSDKLQVLNYGSNSSQAMSLNHLENTVGQELRYNLLHAGNTVVAEYRFEVVNYESAPRDSITHFALAGLDEDFTAYLKLVLRGGATFRDYTNGPSRTDPYFEGSLTYDGPHRSSLALRVNYGLEEPSEQAVQSRTTFRIGLEYKYGLTDRITATLAAYYHHDDNTGLIPAAGTTTGSGAPMSEFSEDNFDISLNLRYQMSHRFSIETGIQYSEVSSPVPGRDYSRLRSFGGFRITF